MCEHRDPINTKKKGQNVESPGPTNPPIQRM